MTFSSHAPFDEHGWGMLIRDVEYLTLYITGSNDVRQDAPQAVTQDNSEPQSTPPPQLTGFDGMGGFGNLSQPQMQQGVQAAQTPVAYPITAPRGGTGLTTIPAHAVMLGEGTANVATAAPGTSGLPLVSNGAAADPSFQAITIASTTGTLAIARGGTNSTTALSGSSIMVSNGTNIIQGAAGTTTTVLHGNAGGAPTYSAVSLTADVTGTLPIGSGGTGGTTQGTAQTALGLGTICTQNANNVNITGGYLGALRYQTRAVFSASGTWTVPAGITSAMCVLLGAGGGGGGAAATVAAPSLNLGGGGGAGGSASIFTFACTPAGTFTVTIGTGGAGGAAAAAGTIGGTSTFTNGTITYQAIGGGGGIGATFGSGISGYGGRPSNGSDFIGSGELGMFNIPGVAGEHSGIQSIAGAAGNITQIFCAGGRGGTSVNAGTTAPGTGGAGAVGGTLASGNAGNDGYLIVYY